MAAITTSEFRDAWRGIDQAQALGILGISRRTWRRWLSGRARIPRSAYELGRVLSGDTEIYGWTGWRFMKGALYDPAGTAHTRASIATWHWTARRLQALRAEENTTGTDTGGNVVSLRRAHRLTAEIGARVSRGSR